MEATIEQKPQEPKPAKSTTEYLSSILPLITIILIAAGYFNWHSYYSKFGFEIYNYLDGYEIIFSFSNIFYEGTTYVVIVLWNFLWMELWKVKGLNWNIAGKDYKRQMKIVIAIIVAGMIILFLIALFYFKFNFRELLLNTDETDLIIFFSLLYIIYTLLFNIRYGAGQTRGLKIMVILITVLFYLQFRNSIRYGNIINGNPKYSIELKSYSVPSETIVSNNTTQIFIGATHEYYFFVNKDTKKVNILKNKDYKEVFIKELRKGI